MVTAVDTNIFLDITSGGEFVRNESALALENAAESGPVVISTVCYSELSVSFRSKAALDQFLRGLKVRTDDLDAATAFLAGQFQREYKLRGGSRTRILADFLIAAHAQLHADRLLTRDSRFFLDSFPSLKAVAPEEF